MEKKILAVLFSLICVIGLSFGQGYTFKVLANKGKNQVKKASGEVETLKTGAQLFDQEEIIAGEGAYIGLVHRTGKTSEVRGAGTRKISDIAASINTEKTSAASRYAQFIAAKMNESNTTGNRQRTNTIGAVSRSFSEFVVFLPSKSEVYSDEATVSWLAPGEESDEPQQFVVSITNVFGEELYKEVTASNSVQLDFSEMENESGFYIFKVSDAQDERIASDEYGMQKVGAQQKPAVAEGLGELLPELTETAMDKLLLAGFYEENGLLVDAASQYAQLVQSAPDVEDFQALYDDFLEKNGLVPEEEGEDE